MKTLLLLRHAKSSWSDPDLADFDRPLNKRGERAAPFMGQFMRARGYVPEIIVSSPAKRAKRTSELAAEAGAFGDIIRFDERIYESSPQTLLEVISALDDSMSIALVVGHNPGMEGALTLLTGEVDRMPTAALAVIDLDVDRWADVGPGSGRLREFIKAKKAMKAAGVSKPSDED
jgi:phosphohistidine phosphatase